MTRRSISPATGGLLYMALGPTLLSYGLFLWAIQRIEVSRASLWTPSRSRAAR